MFGKTSHRNGATGKTDTLDAIVYGDSEGGNKEHSVPLAALEGPHLL